MYCRVGPEVIKILAMRDTVTDHRNSVTAGPAEGAEKGDGNGYLRQGEPTRESARALSALTASIPAVSASTASSAVSALVLPSLYTVAPTKGPAATISGEATSSYLRKFSANKPASFWAVAS
ncbi:hypothetical protein Pla108_29550 [Botrimarina colliarenosi]|uniref:Uncharacterized protein n=1 Tax=Botrimarina colliarenosi TaxID=2528001 RepID=A0A5C6A997_9BACT|nr:hypothetical protein Pla108_29550 [Botrimarina colliarenosi]